MQIWLDTTDLTSIEEAKQMGILYGVTTNPTLVAKAKLCLEDLLEKILQIQKGPVTAQVTAEAAPEMIRQGEALFNFSNRVVVKVPVTKEGLKAIHALSQSRIPTMATAVFDINQLLLSASAGAAYIAPYFSRICEAEIDGFEMLKAMLRLLHRYQFGSKLLAASLRTAEQVRECAEMGAHAVTVKEDVFSSLVQNHPQTVKTIDQFTRDWKGAQKRRSLPF